MIEKLYCEIGQHEFERESKRGRKPLNCPEHRLEITSSYRSSQPIFIPSNNVGPHEQPIHTVEKSIDWTIIGDGIDQAPSTTQALINAGKELLSTRELYCHGGDHMYQAERKRGKPPRNCPEHAVTGAKERKVELDSEKKEKAQEALQDQIRRLSARVEDAEIVEIAAMKELDEAGGSKEAAENIFIKWLRADNALLNCVESLRARERKLTECI